MTLAFGKFLDRILKPSFFVVGVDRAGVEKDTFRREIFEGAENDDADEAIARGENT
eukprot:CAMPEP_0194064924 /NCGR_PEP_ID=MMETSP0009_2-20130614/84337_1 /TAXON_ID=210454 /ORGANISM="Grammatophora oceanica, Strain CCMP 410" /LENGTH=55 /DNA_ID=CAMNT_0038717593 /DNA_START=65 /DNA_END=229 /DNA_ORIENTATION=-